MSGAIGAIAGFIGGVIVSGIGVAWLAKAIVEDIKGNSE